MYRDMGAEKGLLGMGMSEGRWRRDE